MNIDACVSVVIPSRDGRETLQRAIDSVLLSSPYVLEIIVVYSNSPQEFRTFCEGLASKYAGAVAIRTLDSGPASNGSIARNTGIDAARAPWLALLDDDDEWFADKLKFYLDHIKNRQLEGDFVLFSQVVACREDKSEWSLLPALPYDGRRFSDFLFLPFGGAQTSSLFLATSLAQRVKFDPSLIRHQDYDFCMRLEEAGAKFVEVSGPLAFWYQRGSNTAKGGSFEFCSNWVVSNASRLSRKAFIAYVEKELFSLARRNGHWRDFRVFILKNFTPSEIISSVFRLSLRAVRALGRRVVAKRSASFTHN